MPAIHRALMPRPRLPFLSESSPAFAFLVVDEVFQTLGQVKREGVIIAAMGQNKEPVDAVGNRG
jgi:ABC-type branched-subunit amino acid transport system ATPase component